MYKCNEYIYEEMGRINPNKILSATQCNIFNEESLDYHRQFDPSEFAPILGYFDKITEEDLGKHLINGKRITEEDLNDEFFFVEKGHHRATIAAEQQVNIPYSI
jgi:hypothetical protein